MTFKDHFSETANDYARFRPAVPARMAAWLADQCPRRDAAWDVGTGSGQTARALSPFFHRVAATDASAAQLANAARDDKVQFVQCLAERAGLRSHSIDLVTSSQAIHWFDAEAFFAEVWRVLRPGGAVAVWCYGLHAAGPPVDGILEHFYHNVVGPYWPPEREAIMRRLRGVSFPFHRIAAPAFAMTGELTLDEMRGYISTWSASKRYREDKERDPLDEVNFPLKAAWGDPSARRRITWPLYIRVGKAM